MFSVQARRRIRRGLWAMLAWVGLTVASEATAQQTPDAPKPPPGYEKFEPAPESEQVNADNLVVLAYGAVFFGLFGYLVFVARGQSEMGKEMAELAARLDRIDRS